MGITSKLDAFPSEVIGGLHFCCTMLEMADANATLANGGVHHSPTILDHVVHPDRSVQNFVNSPGNRVFSYGEAYAATSVLKGVIQSGTGTAADYGCPAAGKTGTAQNMDNAWFVGYTPKLATAVWVGYPQGDVPMSNGFGGALAAPIWHDFMSVASDGFCGDWGSPSNPFQGTAFSGAHSSANLPPPSSGSGHSGGGNGSSNPYNNPTLFAQPTQPSHSSGGAGIGSGSGSGSGGGHSGTGTGGSGHSGGGHHHGGGGGGSHSGPPTNNTTK
jgi:penicillin-binding protein 1A